MKGKILVVDDEPAVVFLMRQIFRKEIREHGFEVMFAKDGEEALNRMGEVRDIDVVLTDINMPGMDGLTLLTEIKDRFPAVVVIIVSAYFDPENILAATQKGAYDFINKPLKIPEMRDSVQRALDQAHGGNPC